MKTTTAALKFRPFTLADAPAVVNLFNACSQALFGWDDADLTQMMIDWTSPGLNPEEVIRVLEDDQGNIVGYIEVWDTTQPHVVKYVWGVMHPEHWDDAHYHDMLAWAEACARSRISLAPPETRVVMSQGLPNQDIRRKKALEAYGFQLVRHFFRMEIDLTHPCAAPNLPDGMRIEPMDPDSELRDTILALEDGFKDHWGHVDRPFDEVYAQYQHYIKNDPDFDPSLWPLAKSGDQIAGVCRSSAKTVEDPDMGWVNQLCVRKPWRRQGLGMALLLMAFNDFYRRGAQRAGLAVDAASLTNATRLYEKAGMHVTKQYNSYEMELRPGNNLTTD
jgi:ribosomal protein S18 acetylase RimI-like enzyme